MTRFALIFVFLFSASALAQPPDRLAGPADVINGARQATDAAESVRADLDSPVQGPEQAVGEPSAGEEPQGPSGDGPMAPPSQPTPEQLEEERLRAEARRALSRANSGPGEMATSRRDPSTPPGTIRVQVVDGNGQRVAGAPVRIGIMAQASARDERLGETDSNGQYEITGLPTGEGQAYRVTVPADGAVYATAPFRLEVDAGQMARVVRLGTTRSTDPLLIQIGQTLLEYRNERIHITEQMRVTNLGQETVVFGEDGQHFLLPSGFTAFQTQPMMTDQRLVPDDDGFALKGSIPPGTITLAWVYDIPLDGGVVSFSHPLPFKVFRYRVMSDASTAMRMEVAGFPPAEARELEGRRLLVTEISRGPEQPRLDQIAVTVRGIPGPGPLRWIAIGGALILLMFGFMLFSRLQGRSKLIGEARQERQDELLAEARELSALFAASEIGPKYHARRMGELEAELASLLRLDAADVEEADRSKAAPKKKKPAPKHNRRRGA